MNSQNILALYVGAFTDELARAGLADVCFCPGSRSAPLALTFAADPRFKMWQHLDERSAAFFALGMAKAKRRPVIVLCTSGSAAANFFPAIVEARYARVPLIVLTADRPHELRDAGAPQTMDQLKLYGDYAKWFVEMALPEASDEALRYARGTAARAAAVAVAEPAGVAHLNFPFREPLVPLKPDVVDVARAEGRPFVAALSGPRTAELQWLADELTHLPRGVIVAGMQNDPGFPAAVTKLAAVLHFPLLADPLSGVRCGPHDRANVIDNYDAFLRDAATVEKLEPQIVLRLGAPPTSKPVLQYLQRHPNARHIVIADGDDWPDPARLATEVVHADAAWACSALADLSPAMPASPPPSLKGKGVGGSGPSGWPCGATSPRGHAARWTPNSLNLPSRSRAAPSPNWPRACPRPRPCSPAAACRCATSIRSFRAMRAASASSAIAALTALMAWCPRRSARRRRAMSRWCSSSATSRCITT
jgi:2-succinyl-5-enolpyruvyl-6-hydroxy-3-cyclohexene-1-carboxylate synthase